LRCAFSLIMLYQAAGACSSSTAPRQAFARPPAAEVGVVPAAAASAGIAGASAQEVAATAAAAAAAAAASVAAGLPAATPFEIPPSITELAGYFWC